MRYMNLFMSLIRALKRFFLLKEEQKNPVRLRQVTDEELLGRLQRGMSLEHITCDEYVPVPVEHIHFHGLNLTEKKKEQIKAKPEETIAKAKITRTKKKPYPQLKGTNYRTGSYEEQVNADSNPSGYNINTFGSVAPHNYSSGFSPELLKEAIEDAKAVRATAMINAKMAMEQAFGKALEKEEAFTKAFKKNREHVLNNTIKPVILPPKIKDKISGLEMDDFDLAKILSQRRVKVYDNEKW